MKTFKKNRSRPLLFALLLGFSLTSQAQVSVVPSTGIAPRFPKADGELGKQTKPPSRKWLLDANDDVERMRRIELWAGAGDLEMQDIAHRFEELHSALQKGNWDLSIYHLEKIRGRMTVAGIKRPTRTQNMEEVFLDSGVYKSMHDSLTGKNIEQARIAFQNARSACMTCHTAEKLGFINDSTVFKRTEAFQVLQK
ncbi:MAG: hypothetical protein ABL923_10190 [Burkholderiaceae bacterium]